MFQNNCRNQLSSVYQKQRPVRTYSTNQLRSAVKLLKKVASRMILNIYQMKYNNLKITREGDVKEGLFGLTHPIQKT